MAVFAKKTSKKMQKFFFLLSLTLFLFQCKGVFAEQNSIMVKVGDNLVTLYDVEKRIALLAAFGEIHITNKEEKRMVEDFVIKDLIDEKIFSIEGDERGVFVEESEVTGTITTLLAANKITKQNLVDMLEKRGLAYSDLENRIAKKLLWNKLLQNVVFKNIYISDQDIQENAAYKQWLMQRNIEVEKKAAMEEAANSPGPEDGVNFVEISMPIEKADKLVISRILQGAKDGEDLDVVIDKNFGEATWIKKKDVGWITVKDLNPTYVRIITRMKRGDITEPIQVDGDVVMLQLVDFRESLTTAKMRRKIARQKLDELRLKQGHTLADEEVKKQLFGNIASTYAANYLSNLRGKYLIQFQE